MEIRFYGLKDLLLRCSECGHSAKTNIFKEYFF